MDLPGNVFVATLLVLAKPFLSQFYQLSWKGSIGVVRTGNFTKVLKNQADRCMNVL